MKPFEEAQSKVIKAYTQSGQYHTITESRVRLTLTTQKKKPFNGLNSKELPVHCKYYCIIEDH